ARYVDRVLPAPVRRMHHKAAPRLDRPAEQNRRIGRLARVDLELAQQIVQPQPFDRVADADAQRAFAVMRAHRDHCAFEARMAAWGKSAGVAGHVTMLADGNGDFPKALGLSADMSAYGMGTRGKRFSMVVNDGVVEQLNVEGPGEFRVSTAEHMLESL